MLVVHNVGDPGVKARGGECAYCHKIFPKLTKEHVVPKCYGGVYTIRVCAECNNKRGSKLEDPRFVRVAARAPGRVRRGRARVHRSEADADLVKPSAVRIT